MKYVIQTAMPPEIDLMLTWANAEGWNPGLKDQISFREADPAGFFIGHMDGVPVASLAAIRYSDEFGFMGLYIVKPECRGLGMGLSIWKHGIDYLKDVKIIGLDGVVAQQNNYKKFGFCLAHKNIRYSGKVLKNKSSEKFIDLNEMPIKKISSYESKLFPSERSRFLSAWIKYADRAIAMKRDNEIAGYGVIRKCGQGYKIGPLFANDEYTADQLFLGLCEVACSDFVFLDVPMPNKQAIKLAEKYHLQPVFETARMYTNQFPCLDIDRIYGITSFELG